MINKLGATLKEGRRMEQLVRAKWGVCDFKRPRLQKTVTLKHKLFGVEL